MSSMAAQLQADPVSEANMQGFDLPGGASGIWQTLVFAVLTVGGGVAMFINWWRKNNQSNTLNTAETGARINSLQDLRDMLAAERDDHAKEVAALRAENTALRDRADKFAAERNDWMIKFGDVSGELRAVRQELESLRGEIASMRSPDGKP